MCSLSSITYVNAAPITLILAAMYSQNGITAIAAFITGGKDKYFFMSSKVHCYFAPHVNSASFFNRAIRPNALIFPDKLKINHLK
jgi:hypothetical protein